MTETEHSILKKLNELDAVVKSLPGANPKPDLQALFADLDELTHRLPTGTDPNLLHYLHRKSYEKARLHLEGQDAENARGQCPR